MTGAVRCLLQDGVATLTLDRPDGVNALGPALVTELATALRACTADPRTRAVVLTGAGRTFSAGGDIGWLGEILAGSATHAQAEICRHMEDLGNPLTLAIAGCPVPVIAAVNGPCVGGAVGIALAADIVLAARSAYFLVPQVPQLGIVPDLGTTWLLPRLVGRSRALGIALLGERIGAAQAEQWGLVWRCVDDEALHGETQALARRLGKAPTAAVRDARQLIDAALSNNLSSQLAAECTAQRHHVASKFFNDACTRFLARSAHH